MTRRLFEAVGIEIEVALVDRASLEPRPIAHLVLADAAGGPACDHDDGEVGWSNELVDHQLEFKNPVPTADLAALEAAFGASLGRADALLRARGARALPGGMHPWMRPEREAELWPGEGAEVYRALDALYDCRRHGYANVQSTHLNLPFGDAGEFGRLLAAVRFLLPVLPALAAASPVCEGRVTGLLDTRLEHYRRNGDRTPSIVGGVVPEPVYDPDRYRAEVLAPIYAETAPLDADGVLGTHEWQNARGAIARFDRDAVEVRVLDAQEHVPGDLAVCGLVAATLRDLVEGRRGAPEALAAYPQEALCDLLWAAARDAEAAPLPAAYAAALGLRATTTGELWRALADGHSAATPAQTGALAAILERGPLARRLLGALGPEPSRERLAETWRELCLCLDEARPFAP